MAFLPYFKLCGYHRLMGDMGMICASKAIYRHLRTNLLIQWTWGFHSPKSLTNGLQFNVRGLAFQGMIRIRLNSDNNRCVLMFFNERGEQVRKIWDIPLESLISVLDRNIDGVDGDWWQAFKKQYVLNQVEKKIVLWQ